MLASVGINVLCLNNVNVREPAQGLISETLDEPIDESIDARRAYFAALCMEEMAGNIVQHGFTKDTKRHSADIRVVHKADEIILLIRDDCVAFNPSDHAVMLDPGEDGMKNAGIRLVYSIAKEINYQNLLEQNVLTIRV